MGSTTSTHYQTVQELRDSMEKLERSLSGIEDQVIKRRRVRAVRNRRGNETARVLSGPLVGEVGETFAVIVLEVNVSTDVNCYLSIIDIGSPDGRIVAKSTTYLSAGIPGRFVFRDLNPGETYSFSFDGIRKRDMKQRVGTFRTWGGRHCSRIKIALVGDCGEVDSAREFRYENAWNSLRERVKSCELVLHLGSQVHGLGYDHERIFVSNVQRQLETRISAEQYRSTFNIPRVRYVYANSSNLAICGRLDRDLGRECYNRYQSSSLLLQLQSTNELYHKHVYGPIGIFCLHESGYRRWAGETRDASMHVYSKEQLESLNEMLCNKANIRLVIVATSEPIVQFSSQEMMKLEKCNAQQERERYSMPERTARVDILDRLFHWKRKDMKHRDVVLVTETSSVSFETWIADSTKSTRIRQIAVGPTIRSSGDFLPTLQGTIAEGKYTYEHKIVGKRSLQDVAVLTLSPVNPTGPVEMTSLSPPVTPWPLWPKISFGVEWHGNTKPSPTTTTTLDIPLILQPTPGKITSTSATFVCEIDVKEKQEFITCSLIDTLDGRTWRQILCFDNSNRLTSFVFENLRPNRSYSVMIEKDEQYTQLCGTIRTPPTDPETLSVLCMKSTSLDGVADSYEHVLKESMKSFSNTEHVNIHLSSLVRLNGEHFSHTSTLRKRKDVVMEKSVFRNAFRRAFNIPTLGYLLRNTSNIFASDFMRDCKIPQDAASALKRSREYEREFWDPRWKARLSAAATSAADFKQGTRSFVTRDNNTKLLVPRAHHVVPVSASEYIRNEISRRYYFRRSGESFGIFVFDLWDRVFSEDGRYCDVPLVSEDQWTALENALSRSDWMSTIVLVSTSPVVIESAEDMTLKKDLREEEHNRIRRCWSNFPVASTRLMRMLFTWKRSDSKRSAVLVCGCDDEMSVCLETTIWKDNNTSENLKQYICPHLKSSSSSEHFEMSGTILEQFTYRHKRLSDVRSGFLRLRFVRELHKQVKIEHEIYDTASIPKRSHVALTPSSWTPKWYESLRAACENDSSSDDIRAVYKETKREFQVLEKRLLNVDSEVVQLVSLALSQEREKTKEHVAQLSYTTQHTLVAWRKACKVLLEHGCSGLESRGVRLPSENAVRIVLVAAENDSSLTSIVARCVSMLFETLLSSKLSSYWDSMCIHRYAKSERRRVMLGQEEFEKRVEEISSNNKTFDYDTAYLEVMQRRKYAWRKNEEEEKKDGEDVVVITTGVDDRKEEDRKEE